MRAYDVCLSFKFSERFEHAQIIKNLFDKEKISCYFDYDDQSEIIEKGLALTTEVVYGSYSKFKIVLLSDNYFIENSIPYKEWNAINNSLKKSNNSANYFLVCSSEPINFLKTNNFRYFNYSNINILAKELAKHIKSCQTTYKYPQFNLNQVVQDREIENISNLVFKDKKSILLKASSGAGKTEFVKSIVRFHTFNNDENTPIIYYDFSVDTLGQEMSIKTILNQCMDKKVSEEDLPNNLLEEDTLSHFAKNEPQYSTIISDLYSDFVDKHHFAEALSSYFQWLIKEKKRLIVIFDNFQRCSNIRNDLLFDKLAHLENIQYIFINNTSENIFSVKELIDNLNVIPITINLPEFKEQDIFQVIMSKVRKIDDYEMSQIASLSKKSNYYNLKTLDLLCCFYNKFGRKALQLRASDALTLLTNNQKNFLKLLYVAGGIINSTIAEKIFKHSVSDIKLLESLHCVTIKNNKITFAHDTVSIFTKEISQNLNNFCKESQLKITMSLTDNKIESENLKFELMETYNKIVLLSNGTWFNALGIFAEYIKLLSIKQAYHTIIEIKESFSGKEFDPFEYLNHETLGYLLEAYIKTANIQKGIDIVNSLNSKSKNIVRLESRLMIQNYDYDHAISKLSHELEQNFDAEIAMMLCNALAHKRFEDQILDIINRFEDSNKNNQYYHIILRNTGHLFDVDSAIANIKLACKYFSNKKFEEATCYNNLGLQYIRKYLLTYSIDILNLAEDCFKRAKCAMELLNESEVYQSTYNLSLVEACKGNFKLALRYVQQALSLVSKDLSFDINKFIVTKYCLELLTEEISAQQCLKLLKTISKKLSTDFEGHDIDFWLPYQVAYNIEIISCALQGKDISLKCNEISKIYFKNKCGEFYSYKDNYGMYCPCNVADTNVKLLFATSPHWRY